MPSLPSPPLALLTAAGMDEEHMLAVAAAACRAGWRWVQLRDKDLAGRALLARARRLRELTASWGASLVVNDRVDVALAVGADGVHLPASGLAPADARRLVGPDMLVGRSVHSCEEIAELHDTDVDYVQFGPVFATASKARFGPPQGMEKLSRAVETARARGIATVAVGGITAARAGALRRLGTAGVAVIGALAAAHAPEEAAASFLAAWMSLEAGRG